MQEWPWKMTRTQKVFVPKWHYSIISNQSDPLKQMVGNKTSGCFLLISDHIHIWESHTDYKKMPQSLARLIFVLLRHLLLRAWRFPLFCVFAACRVRLLVCAESYTLSPGGLRSPQPPADNGHFLETAWNRRGGWWEDWVRKTEISLGLLFTRTCCLVTISLGSCLGPVGGRKMCVYVSVGGGAGGLCGQRDKVALFVRRQGISVQWSWNTQTLNTLDQQLNRCREGNAGRTTRGPIMAGQDVKGPQWQRSESKAEQIMEI